MKNEENKKSELEELKEKVQIYEEILQEYDEQEDQYK